MATTEELNKAYTAAQTSTTTAAAPGNTMPGADYNSGSVNAITQIYDAQQKANAQKLENAYNQSMSGYQAAQEKIAPQYQTAANDLATQYERQRQAFNRNAAANGINSGTASQAALAQNNSFQKNLSGIRTNEANAQAAVERQMADLKAEYQNNIKSALAQNDYERATALLNEYKNGYNRNLQQAQIMAEFGQFTGNGSYENIFGKEQANAMQQIWAAQNPDLAYQTGSIDGERYKEITGVYPVGYTPTGGGYGGGGGSGEPTGEASWYYQHFVQPYYA